MEPLAQAAIAPPANLPASKIPLYSSTRKPQEFDVHQALTADCWLEATLVAIVRISPKNDNGDRTVTVFLYDHLTLLAVNLLPKVENLNFSQNVKVGTLTITWVWVIHDALNLLVNGTVFIGMR